MGRFAPQARLAGAARLSWTRPLGAGAYLGDVRARGADETVATASRRLTMLR